MYGMVHIEPANIQLISSLLTVFCESSTIFYNPPAK